jgi:FAD-dependent oxidoreductase domain-containing protein 1
MSNNTYDIVIIGGGIMGGSTAYHLMSLDKKLKVAVVEMDPTYEQASSTLSGGNIRIHFSLKENIQISQHAFEVIEQFEEEMAVEDVKPNINFRPEGNLFLYEEEGLEAAEKVFSLQRKLGCQVEWWLPEKIKEIYPLYATTEIVGGTFGPIEGYLDGYAFLMGYKAKARSLGVKFINDEVVEILTTANGVTGVRIASGDSLRSKYVINCAGAWAAKVAQSASVKLPVVPTVRGPFILDTKVKPEKPLPLTVLPSGLAFRTETGNLILVGKGVDSDPVGFNFTVDDKKFYEIIWPELAQFVPAFDTLKLIRSWAGLYAVNTFDGNAILGEWPELKGLFLANGFSGHGLQQGPASGRYLSELILGKPPTLDLSIFRPERIFENKPLSEFGLI